ncbi:DUF6300 family protein [Streptomyces sp. NPDC005283]|uniref:DUF6300 family protein n=1 Tax=Streptomyces sp. NPDC005283 TaxID=3156871 RepID=UPI003454EFA2
MRERPGKRNRLQLADPPNCSPCGGPGLLLAQFPHSWKNARGEDDHSQFLIGSRVVVGRRAANRCQPQAAEG